MRRSEDEPGYVWDFFEPTVTMSTYLVAFVVSELDVYLANPSLSNVEFRIWARPDRIGDARLVIHAISFPIYRLNNGFLWVTELKIHKKSIKSGLQYKVPWRLRMRIMVPYQFNLYKRICELCR